MRRRAAAAMAVGTGLVISLAGCDGTAETGTSGMKLTAAQAVQQSAQRTGRTDTFRADLTVASDNGAAVTKIHATGRFRMRPTPAADATVDEISRGGQRVPWSQTQLILTGDVLYVKLPQIAQTLSGGRSWARADLARLGDLSGVDVVRLIGEAQQKVNPAQQTKMFTASDDVRRTGTETIDGVRTTRYTGSVTVHDAFERLDARDRDALRRLYPEGAQEEIHFDLWADSDGLPRKVVTKGSAARDETSTITVVYSDYGKQVSIAAPPADQVGTLDLGRIFGGS